MRKIALFATLGLLATSALAQVPRDPYYPQDYVVPGGNSSGGTTGNANVTYPLNGPSGTAAAPTFKAGNAGVFEDTTNTALACSYSGGEVCWINGTKAFFSGAPTAANANFTAMSVGTGNLTNAGAYYAINGTTAAPGYAFTNSNSSGMYFDGTNVAFTVSNHLALYLNTFSVISPFVFDSTSTAGFRAPSGGNAVYYNRNASSNQYGLGFPDNTHTTLFTAGTQAASWDASGNLVNAGTITHTWPVTVNNTTLTIASAATCGGTYINTTASATITLPAYKQGCPYTFCHESSTGTLTVQTPTPASIGILSPTLSGGTRASTTKLSCITVEGVDGTNWQIISLIGTWT